MLQAVLATAASLLLLASCGTSKVPAQAALAEMQGHYRWVCGSFRAPPDVVSRLQDDCSSKVNMAGIRVRQDDSAQWVVTDFANQPLGPSSEWTHTWVEGHACLGVPFASFCKVPTGVPVFGALGGDTPISSATGYVFVSQGLIADLIKVETNE